MEFKLTAEGDVIEQLHKRKRLIIVSIYQTRKYLIIDHMNHHNLRQTYPNNVLNTDARSPSKLGFFTTKASRQNISVYIELTFSSLSDFIIALQLQPFARLHLSIMQGTTIITALYALAMINNKKLQRLMK